MASVAAMGALALGVGATSTFAWYQANANSSITTTGINAQKIVATEVNYDVGSEVTLTAAFSAVTMDSYKLDNPAKLPTWHAAYTAKTAESSAEVAAYNALYGTSIVWDEGNPPTLTAQPAIFAPVELTNATGETYAYTQGGLVDVSSSVNRDVYGVAKVTFTLSTVVASTLSQIPAINRTQTLRLTTDGNAKILGSGNTGPEATTARYAHANIDFVLTITASGTYSATIGGNAASETSSGSGVWELQFYYGMAPAFTDLTDYDEVSDHSTDAIKVVANPA